MTKDDAAKAVREKFKASTEGEGDAYTHGWFDGRDAASAEPVNAPQKPNGQRIIDGLKDAVAYANGDNSKGTSETFNAPQQVTTECDHGFIPYKGEMVCDKCGKYNYQVALPQNAEMIEALLKYPAVFKYDEMPKEFAELLKLARIKNRQIIAEAIATERGHAAKLREALKEAIRIIEVWFKMHLQPKDLPEVTWKIYLEQSPEMGRITSALAAPTGEKHDKQ